MDLSCIVGNEITHSAVIDRDKLKEFLKTHDGHMNKKLKDPTGHGYSFRYTPSSVCTSVHITCGCNVELDVTDYSNA